MRGDKAPPLTPGMIRRPRLHSLIQEGLRHPLLVMLAGPGYGKTQAMADYLAHTDADVLWLRLGNLDNLQTHFWNHLIQALKNNSTDIAKHLQALEFPDTLSKFDAFLRVLADEICGQRRVIWVFDDFGEIDDQKIKNFCRMLAEVDLKNFNFVLISNRLAGTESIAYMASDCFLILGRDLKFTRDEIAELYRTHGAALKPDELSALERHTEGWALPLHILVMQRDKTAALSGDRRLTRHEIPHMFEERFFKAYSNEQQKLLVKLSLPNYFTEEIAKELSGGNPSEFELLQAHMFITKEPATGRFSCHNLYRLFLQKKLNMLSEKERFEVWRLSAEHYAATGEYMEAVSCYRKCEDHKGMLGAICDFVKLQHNLSGENAAFLLEHLDLLSPEEERVYPIAAYLKAATHLDSMELERAEALLADLERRLAGDDAPDMTALLGEAYAIHGLLNMTLCREDFGDYFRRAADCLPGGTCMRNREKLFARNNHSFSMADSLPGAMERMERAVHRGVPWANKVFCGGMSGLEHIFSSEAAYLTCRMAEAQHSAYRAIYKAEADSQHDLVCNGYFILARAGLMSGDFAEMSRQIQNLADYNEKHETGLLREICDTALAWYFIKLGDHGRIPRSILAMGGNLGGPASVYDRSQIAYADYLIHTKEYARLAGMLEYHSESNTDGGIRPDRIGQQIMLAIAYHHLEKPDNSMKALWTAYDMSYNNRLDALFIEAGEYMCALIDSAKKQGRYKFEPKWLDRVHEEAAGFAKRAERVRADYRKHAPVREALANPLTRREMEILHALSRGLTREEIAVERFISVNTIKTFIRSIYNKLDASNRAEAVSIAISKGYIELPGPRGTDRGLIYTHGRDGDGNQG